MENQQPPTVFNMNFRYSQHQVEEVEVYEVKVILEGFEVLCVLFGPDNFKKAIFEKLKLGSLFFYLSDEKRGRLYEQARKRLAEMGHEISDEQIRKIEPEALRELELKIIKDSIESSTKRVSENLPNIVAMVFEKLLQATAFAGANDLRELIQRPEQKYSAKEIKDALFQSDWERLKPLVGATTGGARNVKHEWTDEQRACLASNYERLQPIWVEAKRIAKAAQKSKEPTRSQRWREEVSRAYPDLPADLIERLSAPRSEEAKPADIALTHAARLCVPVTYTTRRLRDEIKTWKLKITS